MLCMQKLVDVHCHLDFEQFDPDREKIIEECKEKLRAVVNSGTSLKGNKRTMKLAEENKNFIFPALGLHPTYLEQMNRSDIEEVKKFILENKDKIVAVGEIGIDYFHFKDKEVREKHKEIFKEFLDLAEKINKPVVIHSRDADKHALRILENYNLKAIMHCFNGNLQLMEKAQNLGFYISVSTQVLYSKRVKEIVQNVDLNKILLETDSPFLGGSERNYPWNIYNSLNKISEIREIDPEKLSKIVEKNTLKIFPQIGDSSF